MISFGVISQLSGPDLEMFHNWFVLWGLLTQGNASVGDAAFQSADAGEEGLKQCLVEVCLAVLS